MLAAFDCELRGRLDTGAKDMKRMKLLNRILTVHDDRLTYEADQRHVILLARALGLEECGIKHTPGAKKYSDEQLADGQLQHEDEAKVEALQYVQALMDAYPRSSKVKFNTQAEVHEIPPYSEIYTCHPRRFVFEGPIGDSSLRRLPSRCDPFTGLPRAELHQREQEVWRPDSDARARDLR